MTIRLLSHRLMNRLEPISNHSGGERVALCASTPRVRIPAELNGFSPHQEDSGIDPDRIQSKKSPLIITEDSHSMENWNRLGVWIYVLRFLSFRALDNPVSASCPTT